MSFNPDQPRDERGRFASDGGGGSSVGKSSGSGPRPVTRGPVQKLSSGHSEASQKTIEQARKYFAKEEAKPVRSGPYDTPHGQYFTETGPKMRSGVFGNQYYRLTKVLTPEGVHIGNLQTKWRHGRTESMTGTTPYHRQGGGSGVMGHDPAWLLRTHKGG